MKNFFLFQSKVYKNKISFFKKKGFKIIYINSLNTKDDFKTMFKLFYKLNYCRIFFETGLTFLNSLLNYKILNNLYVFKSTLMLKRNGLNYSPSNYLKNLILNKKIIINLDGDSLYKKEF